jgi:acyl carrier protein
MIIKRQQILSLVYASIEAINEMRADEEKLELGEDTLLFGTESKLDSLGLVNLVIDIEQRLYDELGVEVILTDERVMSEDTNVFESVKTLVDYISSVLKEESTNG